MEAHESTPPRHKLSNRETVKEKVTLQRKWESEPSASTKRGTFSEPPVRHRESLPCGASVGLAPQQKYATTGNSGKLLSGPSAVGDMGGLHPQDSQGHFAQGFPRGYTYLDQPYPQHPQSEQLLSGAKPQPGLEPHAWPFAGQLPSDDLYPVGHPGHTHPHGAGTGRFPHQKSPSLPSSFGQYSQSVPESLDEGYSKKEQKPKKPGKYICHYCGRACAKPSVLKKHIRSHTGERPYPCVPCGFSFKTKSNLYKHRKSHAHAIKAGLVPFSELAAARAGDTDQVSPVGEAEVHSDGEQSTDTDEEGVDGSTMLTDKDRSIPQISFKADKHTGGFEPAYADSAEELPMGNIKVPILIVPKSGGDPSTGLDRPPFQDMKVSHPHHMLSSQLGRRSHSLEDSPSLKQGLARKPNVKKGQDIDGAVTQSLNFLSPHSKGSTDSGYFSRSESAEQQISPPNTNVKTYEEIMFGRTYYPPNTRPRQSMAVGMAGANPASLANLKQSGAVLDGKMTKDHLCFKGDVGVSGDPKQYPTGPCQSSTGLLEPPSESGHLIRSNSMPTSCPPNLSVPPSIRGSHSFDEMMSSDDVFYPQGLRKSLIRQAAFEQAAEAHVGETEIYGHFPKSLTSSLVMKIGERGPGLPENMAFSSYGTKISMSEQARRKRHIENSEGDEEDCPGLYDSSCSGSVEMTGDFEFKQSSLDGSRGTPTGKGSFSAHSQSDSFDTCASMCSEDISLFPDSEGRKAAGNVISVIQHTNSLSRPNSFEKSESFEQPGHQSLDKGFPSQYSEQSDTEIYEDALSPESALMRTESMEQPLQSDSDLASLSSSSAAPSPGQPYNNPHKLVRQPNIQVPEIRVTEEPDKPEKDAEVPSTKEVDKHHHHQQQQQQHGEEFQLPQRSDTLSQMPSEKLPPKKKRLRLTDMEHSSGESSFESTCTSLSRSPSQESNLSHSSSFSMSFDRDEGLKSLSPTKQDEFSTSGGGTKQSEFLTVPGSGHSSHHHQREMRRSSSEQAPCTLPLELPEMRSKSFDYGSLSPSRQGEVYSSVSAKKERRRGYLVRQVSLSVYSEVVTPEQSVEMLVKQEAPDHGAWSGPTGSPHMSSDVSSRTKRAGSSSGLQRHHQQHLQQSMSEDSLQDEPLYCRSPQYRLQPQGSSSESENPAHEISNKDVIQPYLGGSTFLSYQQAAGLFWSQECGQTTRQQPTQGQGQKLQMRSPGTLVGHSPNKKQPLHAIKQTHDQQLHDGKSENVSSQMFSPVLLLQQQQQQQQQHNLSLPGVSSTMNLQQLQPGMLVPVRIQTHVPTFGSAMYTSVSQLIVNQGSGGRGVGLAFSGSNMSPMTGATKPSRGKSGSGFNLSLFLGQTDGSALRYPPCNDSESLPQQQLKTGIPLSLTSGTISTTDASGSSVGGGKRMLSPTSSLELFIETKQQKRVKEERMYGQILKEMSAVELSGTERSGKHEKGCGKGRQDQTKSDGSKDDNAATRITIPVRSSAPQPPDVPCAESFTPPLQIVTDRCPSGGRDSPEELEVDDSGPEPCSSPQSMISSDNAEDGDNTKQRAPGQTPVRPDVVDVSQYFQFPSLRTISRVSWCFLKYTKPNSSPAGLHSSVYSSWSINSYNPNPLNLSTKTSLALLRSKQRRNTDLVYTTAVLSPPSSGKLVSSVAWKLKFDQLKPELMPVEFGRKMKGVVSWDHSKEEQEQQKEVPVKQPVNEPTRIKIFEGGYKSNEDYVYVRGRGRGKYICEECGIRCKKPSMLKKHIRTHTDVRPYVCKFCNFAFKTKGNLTKHMKSKAHMKKCLELGVSMSSVEDTEVDEGDMADEGQRLSEKTSRGAVTEHQFSDADDSEGGEEDGEEVEDEDDEEDDYDGDSTPKTRSRSTSPQPFVLPALSITAVASSHPSTYSTPDLKPPLFGFFTTVPSIHITAQAPPTDPTEKEQPRDFQRGLKKAQGTKLLVPPSSSMDEDFPDLSSPSSRLSSPGLDLSGCPSPNSPSSSPSARRYLSPRRDLSPRARHLSPRRDISPKRDLLSAAGYRRDASPRRGHLSLLSPLSRPTSPGGRDYKRDLSPRGRHRGVIRPLSPRRGLHQNLHHQSQQGGARSFRPSHQMGALVKGEFVPAGGGRSTTDMETELSSDCPGDQGRRSNQDSPPHQLLFSHLPLHSQLQVRSPFPMIPIGGIQMVHSVPPSVTAPLSQQGELYTPSRLSLQKSTSEESTTSEAAPPPHFSSFMERVGRPRGGGEWMRESPSPQVSSPVKAEGEVRQEQEEGVQTCTKAIASLCIDSGESTERGARGEGGGEGKDKGEPPPSAPPPESRLHRLGSPSVSMSSPLPPPGIQHFSGLDLRPPHPDSPHSSSSSSPQPPPSPQQTPGSKPAQVESENTRRSKEES